MTATWTRPTDGAGTWTHATPHRTLRLTTFGTLVVTGLLTIAFLLTVHLGRALVCRMDVAAVGHPTHTYCPGWKAAPRTDTP
jgi:hypothetical protein